MKHIPRNSFARSIRIAGTCASLIGATAGAQVGSTPDKSPYRDIERKHEFTLLYGPYKARKDPAGVAPRGGSVIGAEYEWRATGPLHITADLVRIGSSRQVLNPSASGDKRDLGVQDWPLYSFDASFALAITGAKSWHQLVPMTKLGMGVVSDLKTGSDVGGFKFGTRFAFVGGGGVRWTPGGNLQLRADLTDRMYTIAYPDSYYLPPDGGSAVVSNFTSKSRWTHNAAYTIGVSYFMRR